MPGSGKQQGNQQKQKNTHARGKLACQQTPQAAPHRIHLTGGSHNSPGFRGALLTSAKSWRLHFFFFALRVTFGSRTSCQGLSQAGWETRATGDDCTHFRAERMPYKHLHPSQASNQYLQPSFTQAELLGLLNTAQTWVPHKRLKGKHDGIRKPYKFEGEQTMVRKAFTGPGLHAGSQAG